jgi:hypothetical protein
VGDIDTRELAQCDNCGAWCVDDEIDAFELPHVGVSMLCLTCGPEENYAELAHDE